MKKKYYTDVEKLKKRVEIAGFFNLEDKDMVLELIANAPKAGVKKVTRGEWLKTEGGFYRCPFCRAFVYTVPTKFCPDCSARLKEAKP